MILKKAPAVQEGVLADASGETLVELQEVRVSYPVKERLFGPTSWLNAVDGVSFKVRAGETFGLVGETGSGKTTVAKVILRMERPTSGVVRIGGQDVHGLRGSSLQSHSKLIQVVMQDPYASLDPRMRVGPLVAEPLTGGNPFTARKRKVRERVRELLDLVGLPSESERLYPHQFSGGQRQRVAIARALVSSPRLAILDEPTSALDVSVRAQILNLLKDLQQQFGVTYLFISHDLATVAYMATTVAVMYLGRIVEMGPTRDVYSKPLHPYTRVLLASVPGSATLSQEALPALDDESETAAHKIPSGCRFHPRCPLRAILPAAQAARCASEDPALRELGPGRSAACHFAELS